MSTPSEIVNSRVVYVKEIIESSARRVSDLLRFRDVNQTYREVVDDFVDHVWERLLTDAVLDQYIADGNLFVATKAFYLQQFLREERTNGFSKKPVLQIEVYNFQEAFYLSTNYEINKFLVAKGLDINRGDLSGNPTLHKAVSEQRYKVVGALLKAGANPNARDNQNRTPLFHVYRLNYYTLKILTLLRDYGADPNANDNSELYNANEVDLFIEIVNYFPGFNVDIVFDDDDKNLLMTLYDSILFNPTGNSNRLRLLNLLLARGANVNYLNSSGKDSLMSYAVEEGQIDDLLLFIDAGGNPGLVHKTSNGTEKIIDKLFRYYKQQDATTRVKVNANDYMDAIKMLISHDKTFELSHAQRLIYESPANKLQPLLSGMISANVDLIEVIDLPDINGDTLIMQIVKNRFDIGVLKLLLPYEPNLKHRNNQGQTIEDIASQISELDELRALIDKYVPK
jgi:ankyrin repeat protein